MSPDGLWFDVAVEARLGKACLVTLSYGELWRGSHGGARYVVFSFGKAVEVLLGRASSV